MSLNKSSKVKLMLVTVGVITGIIGILTGCAELLNGSLLVEEQNITALPLDYPNQEFYSKMQGYPVFSLLTGIPYFVIGLLAISISIVYSFWLVGPFLGIVNAIAQQLFITEQYFAIFPEGELIRQVEDQIFWANISLVISLGPQIAGWLMSLYYMHFYVRKSGDGGT